MLAGADFGCPLGGYVLSNSRFLQLSPNTPLQIRAVKLAKVGDDVEVTLSGDNDRTRVHVVVSSLPVFTPYQLLCAAAPRRYRTWSTSVSWATWCLESTHRRSCML